MLRPSERSKDLAVVSHKSIRVPAMTATPTMTLRHLYYLGTISIFCFIVIFEEKSLKGLLPSVDNVPKRQASLGIRSNRQASLDTRSNRFPSVEDRVKLYMSNWYVPPCPGNFIRVNRVNATSVAIKESTTTTRAANNQMGRTLFIKSEAEMDSIFFLDRHKLFDCTRNPPANLQSYCQDVQSTLVPALDRVGDDGMTPVFLQFGDSKESRGHGYINLPHIKKIRSSTTQASLSNVTLKHCYSGPRDPLHTKHDKEHLQPVLWKLRTEHHYSMLPHVQGNDTLWSLKKNMTVFRGSLSGYPRGGFKKDANDFENCMLSRRCRLAFRHNNSSLVDARLSRTLDLLPNTIDGVTVTGKLLNMEEQLQYKAIVVVEGNDVATGLKWALLSNSVVMMQPPSHTSWAMEELLEPWVHYIPLNEELSDVEENMQWVLDNDKQAQRIAQRGTLWIQDLVFHPDASNDDKRIQEEIIRRYRAHFVAKDKSANVGSTRIQTLPSFPSVASKDLMFLAFYYPWYIHDDWSQHGTQGSTPLLGHYGSNESEVAERHIDMAVRGGIDVWVVSWWNQDSPVTANFVKGMLSAKNIDKIKFCMIYESMGALPVNGNFANGTLALDKFILDMIFFRDSYFGHPSYLHINGRPVVYVYLTRFWKNFEPFMLEKIKTAVGKDILIIADDPYFGHNTDPATAQNGVKNGKPVFEAYTAYNMYENELVREGERAVDYMLREALPIYEKWSRKTVFFPHLLPKYHDFREGHKPMVGDAAGLLTQLETFACLPRPPSYKNEFPDLMFVTSFNEWWEGTSIEPDVKNEYGYTFLDSIKAFKDSGVQCQPNRID